MYRSIFGKYVAEWCYCKTVLCTRRCVCVQQIKEINRMSIECRACVLQNYWIDLHGIFCISYKYILNLVHDAKNNVSLISILESSRVHFIWLRFKHLSDAYARHGSLEYCYIKDNVLILFERFLKPFYLL